MKHAASGYRFAAAFDHPSFDGHEEVAFVHDAASGLRAIIAIHDRSLGPALGGCRMWTYPDSGAALDDVLRLSRGMTYKNALAGLDHGGGKAVILADPRADKTPQLFEAFGAAVERLGGRYVTAEDVGISDADVEVMARATSHVLGIRATGLGDPSPFTAWGVFCAMRAAAGYRLSQSTLAGLTVAVQGLGHVGGRLAGLIHADGGRLVVADIDEAAVADAKSRFDARAAAPNEIHAVEADIFSPCALGGFLNRKTIPEIKARIVVGAANNQLLTPEDGVALMKRGILYAPDYLVNAGGVISIAPGHGRVTADEMKARIARIGDVLNRVLSRAQAEGLPPERIADRMAEERIAEAHGERRQSA